ncbi:hypothetical protein [Corynebacterium deserti]|nr:hypothetical protein [Corynebacterium deserti]
MEGSSAAGKTTLSRQLDMPFVPQYQPTGLEPDDEAVAVRAHY